DGTVVAGEARPLGRDGEDAPGREGAHVREPGGRLRYVAQPEEIVAGLAVELRNEAASGDDGFDLAREQPLTVQLGVEQRLHAVTVAGQQQPAPGSVVNGERENAPQRLHEIGALLFVQVHEDLGVGGALEDVPPAGQGGAQVGVIIDLAVVDDLDAAVLVGHRLRPAGGEVDECETPVDQLAILVRVAAGAVRAAMAQQLVGPSRPRGVGGQRGGVEPSCQAAHYAPPATRAGPRPAAAACASTSHRILDAIQVPLIVPVSIANSMANGRTPRGVRRARQPDRTHMSSPMRNGIVPAMPVLVINSNTRLWASRLMNPGSLRRCSSSYWFSTGPQPMAGRSRIITSSAG